jgi:hypothetical protein
MKRNASQILHMVCMCEGACIHYTGVYMQILVLLLQVKLFKGML